MWAFSFLRHSEDKKNDSLSHSITIQNTDFKPLYAEVWYYIYFSVGYLHEFVLNKSIYNIT